MEKHLSETLYELLLISKELNDGEIPMFKQDGDTKLTETLSDYRKTKSIKNTKKKSESKVKIAKYINITANTEIFKTTKWFYDKMIFEICNINYSAIDIVKEGKKDPPIGQPRQYLNKYSDYLTNYCYKSELLSFMKEYIEKYIKLYEKIHQELKLINDDNNILSGVLLNRIYDQVSDKLVMIKNIDEVKSLFIIEKISKQMTNLYLDFIKIFSYNIGRFYYIKNIKIDKSFIQGLFLMEGLSTIYLIQMNNLIIDDSIVDEADEIVDDETIEVDETIEADDEIIEADEVADDEIIGADDEIVEAEDEIIEADDETIEDETIEADEVEDETIEDETIEADEVEDETIEADEVEDETIEDETIEDETIEDETIEDEIIEDETIEDEIIEDNIE